jgi:hypothetical protein
MLMRKTKQVKQYKRGRIPCRISPGYVAKGEWKRKSE